MSRIFQATVVGPARLRVDHGFGVFAERDVVLADGSSPLGPAGSIVLATAIHATSRRVTRIQVTTGVPTYLFLAKVVRVVDGDTLWVDVDLWDGTIFRAEIRVLGVNCPESHGPTASDAGRAAAAYTSSLLPAGKAIRIQTQRVNIHLAGHEEKVEVHGRFLSDVDLLDGGPSLGQRLIASGHAAGYDGTGKAVDMFNLDGTLK